LKIKISALVAFFGSIVVIIGMFMPWISMRLTVYYDTVDIATGWEILTGDGSGATYALLAFIMTLAVFAIAIINLIKAKFIVSASLNIVTMAFGVLIFILIFLSTTEIIGPIPPPEPFSFTPHLIGGVGILVSVIGGSIIAIAGIAGTISAVRARKYNF